MEGPAYGRVPYLLTWGRKMDRDAGKFDGLRGKPQGLAAVSLSATFIYSFK